MNELAIYLPQDRRRALALGETLPGHAAGAILFADISGFTPLTEAVTRSVGVRRGAEELTRQLNVVYDALVAQVEKFGGSVVTFSGDAVTCWFAEERESRDWRLETDSSAISTSQSLENLHSPRSTLRSPVSGLAVACAFALQETMRQFAVVPLPDGTTTALAIKVAVTRGNVRRFVVGDPDIRLLDVVAGSTVARASTAEHLTQPGEVLIDTETANLLNGRLDLREWREDETTHERFAVVRAFSDTVLPWHPSEMPQDAGLPALPAELIKPWLHASMYQRALAEGDVFLTELRPVVAMFTRFQGIDFDADENAGQKLNELVCRAQQILKRYDGALLELTIGDKGSYFYATFGAPHTHEDDPRRAVHAARELFALCGTLEFIEPLQIGISQGVMRVGGYGSRTRRTYGAQGDEVNLAARLMVRAAPGELLISGRIQQAVAGEFDLEPFAPIRLKGKAEPLLPFLVLGLRETRVQELQEAYYTLPMIGRERETELAQEKIARARQGKGQVIGITAPAGMGKSRLTAEVIRAVRRRSESSFGGECQSFGANISYMVWAPIWRAFFGIDPKLPLRRQVRVLESELQDLVPERVEAMPLLGALLHMPLAENDFTRDLEPEFRKSALDALLLDCVRAAAEEARAQHQVVLFVIEDAHWIDPASRALLELLAGTIQDLPVAIVLTYRPPETGAEEWKALSALPHFTQIRLQELTSAQGEGLMRAKLAQHTPENMEAVPDALIARLNATAQGNPFYIEQLLDYLHDRGLNVRDPAALEAIELPNTLHRLILSRMDQLSEHQQLALRAASVIGRWFSIAHLVGYFPRLGTMDQVRADLERLQSSDLTTLEHPEPELAYLFKHLVTQQVAYEALAYSTRAMLHGAYAHYLETQDDPTRALDVIAFHYDHSDNLPKRREYLRRAGEAAAARFANVEAAEYLTRALTLTAADLQERCALLTTRERVYDVMGERDKQRADLIEREQLALEVGDVREQINVALRQGWFGERTARYADAIRAAQKAVALAPGATQGIEQQCFLGEAYTVWGQALWEQGDPRGAREYLERSLEFTRAGGDRVNEARALDVLGTIARFLGDYAAARYLHEQALRLARAVSDRRREWFTLNDLAAVAHTVGDLPHALDLYTQAFQIVHEIGDRRGEATLLSNLAVAYNDAGELDRSLQANEQALAIATAIGDRKTIWRLVVNRGETYRVLGEYGQAHEYTERALKLSRELGDRLGEGIGLMNLSAIELARGEWNAAQGNAEVAFEILRDLSRRESEAYVLNTLGQVALAREDYEQASFWFVQAIAMWEALEPLPDALPAYAGLGEVALKRGHLENARGQVNLILAYLTRHPSQQGDPSALAAALTAYRVLTHANDARAKEVLDAARNALAARASKIGDEALRRSFLENVRVNRELGVVSTHENE